MSTGFIDAIVNEQVSLVISRGLLTEFAASLVNIQVHKNFSMVMRMSRKQKCSNGSIFPTQDAIAKAVAHYTLDVVQPRVISFEDQV